MRGRILGTVGLLAGFVFLAVLTVDLRTAGQALAGASPEFLVAATLLYLGTWISRGRRYQRILAAMDRRYRLWYLIGTVFTSQTANLVAPARAGDLVRAYLLNKQRELAYTTGIASLTVERVFDLAAIALLASLLGGWIGWSVRPDWIGDRRVPTVLFVGIGLLIVGLAVGQEVLRRGSVCRAAQHLWSVSHPLMNKFRNRLSTWYSQLATFARNRRAVVLVTGDSVTIWLLDALTAVLVLVAVLDQPAIERISAGSIVVSCILAVCVGNLAKIIPLSHGGIGLYEAGFTATLVSLTPLTAAAALAIAILDHAIKNLVTITGGGVAGILLSDRSAQIPGLRWFQTLEPPFF